MPSDFKIANRVLDTIASQDLEKYLDTLQAQAAEAIKEMDEMRRNLEDLVSPYKDRCEKLMREVAGSIAKLAAIESNESKPKTDRLVAREQLDVFHNLDMVLIKLNFDLAGLGFYVAIDSSNIMLSHQLPLFLTYHIADPSRQEKRAYIVRLFRETLGFVPGVDKAMSVWSLFETSREWINHKAKLSESIKRVQFLIAIAEIVRYIREEGMPEVRKAIEAKRQRYLSLTEIMAYYEGMYKK